jgi:hypothetical protein
MNLYKENENENEHYLYNKDGFTIQRLELGSYNINLSFENKNIILGNIIDFNLIKLLYDLNQDIYEKIEFNKINDNEARLLAINRHFFQDLGISQKYLYLKITKAIYREDNKIVFILKSLDVQPSLNLNIPAKAHQLPIEEFIISCDVIDQHKVVTNINFKINTQLVELPDFIETILCKIYLKMFKRLKQFIENVQ